LCTALPVSLPFYHTLQTCILLIAEIAGVDPTEGMDEASKIAVFSKGACIGLNGSIPVGGQVDPLSCVLCVFGGLCDGLITHSEKSYQVWVCVLYVVQKPQKEVA
jgi:hypothetical protein